ncbi:MAG: nitrate reductase [Blastopirellula sp.]|nr:MAG: nitrate reductase [Blastopirellula sp.]
MSADLQTENSPENESDSPKPKKPPRELPQILHAKQGPLTRELLLEPGNFGLGLMPAKNKPDLVTSSVCGYCSTGCSLNIHIKDQEAVALTPTTNYPVNMGMACPKGWESLTVLKSDDRATTPLLRNESGKLQPIDWHTAATTFTTRMKAIQEKYGKESIAFLGTGQIPTEEMAFLGALTKFGMGMLHGDGNTRQCMATAVVAYKQAFGFDAPPYTYDDFEQSDVIVLVGSNLCIAHPIMWERVMRNPNSPEIIVVDPRMTETAMSATQHAAIEPKSDMALLYGIARILIEEDWVDQDYIKQHTNDFAEFSDHVQDYDLDRVSADTGLPKEQIEQIAKTIADGKRVSFWWTMGVNQSHQGVRTAQAIINLALMTGNMGKPGTGANSITGQCNAMGSRLFSNTTNLLGGYDFANAEDRKKVAEILEIDESLIPEKLGLPYHKIMEGILSKKIRGLWVICTNPAHSWINQGQARDILSRLDFLVVQDMYHTTETAKMADLVLPAAGWGEKEGTFINSERRFSVLKKVSPAPGQALADFSIFRLIADYWGCGNLFKKWTSPEAVFQMMKQLSKDQPCDFSGIEDYQAIDQSGGIQWPYPAESPNTEQQRRLFEDGKYYHADQRAKFLFEDPTDMPEKPSEKYPMLLLTGRGSASQWHTQTRTSKSAVLRKLYPKRPYIEINPMDARRLSIQPGDKVVVRSQRGRVRVKAFLTQAVKPGQVFMSMHYEATNQLTHASFDPYSKQPSYKACAVRVDAGV